ncbi:MAG: DUF4097 family beta strand repeat-containing protein [Oscillospiraceae bacterium]
MKKILCFLIPVCILSFIGFWVSTAILGTTDNGNVDLTDFTHIMQPGETLIFGDNATSDREWEIENTYGNININSAGATTVIEENDGDTIIVKAEVPNGRRVSVNIYGQESEDELTIEIVPDFTSLSDILGQLGKMIRFGDGFDFSNDVTVTVSFPRTIYGQMNLQLGSGKMYYNEVFSNNYNVEIGSGRFEMKRSDEALSSTFNLEMGSGKAMIDNMRAKRYNIKIGSGEFDLAGISGTGELEMGSGKGSLSFTNDCISSDIDIGSGSLDIYLEESGAIVEAEVGSGSVDIDAYGVNTKLKNDSPDTEIWVGNKRTEISIELGSGKVDILPIESKNSLE